MSLFELERNAEFEELVTYLEESSNTDIRRRAAEILGGLASEVTKSRFPREDIVNPLIATAQNDDDDEVRAAAIDALDQYGQDALEQFIGEVSGQDVENVAKWKKAQILAKGLNADRPELRMAAATGLGRIGEDNVVEHLVKRLSDPDPRVRKRVARALGRIGSPEPVPALSQRLHEDRYGIRVEAAYALADIGTNNALRELVDVAEADDERLRRIAVDALGRLGSVEAVEVLAESLQDEAEVVRRTAMFSLVELLSEAPSDASHKIREKIVGELEQVNEAQVEQPLIDLLEKSTETAQRRNAAWLLGRVTSEQYREEAQETLIDTLADDDEMTSKFAATSLSMLDGGSLEERLLELVEDRHRDEGARVKALFVLGKIGGEESRKRISGFVDRTESDRLRKRGFSALSKLGGAGAPSGDFA
ncbi:HEAT repeat domain-containing protein [Natronobacterium gregoryi]|uniref:HEAT repeat-containing protein n=2 Tax=Natronobacterium gregoryi TaxID=44930 RepID=L0AI67_NATGS|nr:HEAT repeat domain-containing protein [Natronobacterium gregoryi]AFZ73114.1 HEAT repeat-containing protein [Natronobacterium gregoryi SP2]ELY70787.1 PBS lyase HEAT domain-containing protein repeat-containing protein [Natronobacterium gregoryi SP2]PLK20367.1 molecular chaperone [Natronobacterium gregoryi SP2]SFI60898.1 HEAT repeat [Natronobacterium gregoryi]